MRLQIKVNGVATCAKLQILGINLGIANDGCKR